jgi:CheY-like chemotaxis protein
MRQTLKRIIAASADLDLVGLARDGEDAVSKARELRPDVVSMDINMPKLDGITALQIILQEKICPVVMVSSLTQRSTTTTFECLELGAFDFVGKPDGNESSLVAIRRLYPDLTTLPDFFLVPCLRAIGALGTAGNLVELACLLAIGAPHLRPAILASLIAIHQRHPAETHVETLLPALQAVVEDGDPPLCRYQAVRAIGLLAPRDDIYGFLVSCLYSPERLVRLGAAESLRTAEQPRLEALLAARALEESDEEVLQALLC